MGRTRKITTESHVKALVKDWFDSVRAWSYAPIQNGLGVHGLPDRVGCVPMIVTPDMVGKCIGVFVAVECKKPGRRGEARRGLSAHQRQVLDAVIESRGVAVPCDGYEDLGALHAALFQQELSL